MDKLGMCFRALCGQHWLTETDLAEILTLGALLMTVPRLPGSMQPRDVELMIMKLGSLLGEILLVFSLLHTLGVLLLKQQGVGPIATTRTPIMEKQNRQ